VLPGINGLSCSRCDWWLHESFRFTLRVGRDQAHSVSRDERGVDKPKTLAGARGRVFRDRQQTGAR
jgi:hypothetical protein